MDAPPVRQRVSKIWILKTGGLDELVLFVPTLALLRAELPSANLRVLIEQGHAGEAMALLGDVDWVPTALAPRAGGPERDVKELERIERMVRDDAPDVLAAAGSHTDWLDIRLASCCPRSRRVAVRCEETAAYPETTRCAPEVGVWKEGLALAALILGRAPRVRPLEISTGASEERTLLRRELANTRKRLAEESEARRAAPSREDPWERRLADADAEIMRLKAEFGAKSAETDLLRLRLEERENSIRNFAAGHAALEVHKHYQRLLREQEISNLLLDRACRDREALIGRLTLEATPAGSRVRQVGLAVAEYCSAKVAGPLALGWDELLLRRRRSLLGELRQHPGRRITWDTPMRETNTARLPRIGVVTPSLNQAGYLQRAIESLTAQRYPKLFHVIQDGGSTDRTASVIRTAELRLHGYAFERDTGKGEALARGFSRLAGALAPDDVMGWVDADDLIAPGALWRVGTYFARHPGVDVVYGHRLVVDEEDREVGRWVLPRHDGEMWRWVDWVPRETLFWRKRAWDKVGGIDPNLHFTLAWDLLLRLQASGTRIVRIPYFIGAKRFVDGQKNLPEVLAQREREVRALRDRVHGAHFDHMRHALESRRAAVRSAFCEKLLDLGIRW